MTTARPPDLPDYERPPLNELVLSIQFGMLPFANVQAGLLWQQFEKEYPLVEEQPPLESVFETFGPLQPRPQPSFELVPFTVASRYWFVTADGNELLQVQRDRLVHNWRRRKSDDQYPRYEPLREKFRSEVDRAAAFFRSRDLGDIACNQCEVGYINLIPLDDKMKEEVGGMEDMFSFLSKDRIELGDIERGVVNLSYLMPNESGKEPLGRLHVTVQPVIDRLADNEPALRLTLTARGKPADQSIDSAFEWLDMGRVAGVRAFTAVTTERMHRLWGRQK